MERKILFILACALALPNCPSTQAAGFGVTGGKLAPCPTSPNCVSSQSNSPSHYADPLPYEGELQEAKERLLRVIHSMGRSRIVTESSDYIHAEFMSAIFRFVDDVEFYFDREHKVVHFRSASRVGYSDLGVNRRRMEKIRGEFSRLSVDAGK